MADLLFSQVNDGLDVIIVVGDGSGTLVLRSTLSDLALAKTLNRMAIYAGAELAQMREGQWLQ